MKVCRWKSRLRLVCIPTYTYTYTSTPQEPPPTSPKQDMNYPSKQKKDIKQEKKNVQPKKIKREFPSRDRKGTTFTGTLLDDVQCTATKSPANTSPHWGVYSSVGVHSQRPHATLVEYSGGNTGTKPRYGTTPTRQTDLRQITSSKRRATLATNSSNLERRQNHARHLTRSRTTCGTTPHWMDDAVRLVIDLDGFLGVYVGLLVVWRERRERRTRGWVCLCDEGIRYLRSL